MNVPSNDFAQRIREELYHTLEKGHVNFKTFERVLAKYNKKKELKYLATIKTRTGDGGGGLISFQQIFTIFLKIIRKPVFLVPLTPPIALRIIHEIIGEIFNEVVCGQCGGTRVSRHTFHLNREHTVYYCEDCGVNVRVINRYDYLPLLLVYFQRVFELQGRAGRWPSHDNFEPVDFVKRVAFDTLELIRDIPDIEAIITLSKFCQINKFDFVDEKAIRRQVTEGLVDAIKHARIDVYYRGKAFIEKNYQKLVLDRGRLARVALDKILEFVTEGSISKVNRMVDFTAREGILDSKLLQGNPDLAGAIYRGLSWCIEQGKVRRFEQLLDFAFEHDFTVEILKIPDRLENITKLVSECIHLQRIENIFEYIAFGSKYELFYKVLSPVERELVARVKKNNLYLANLQDLFGTVNDALLVFLFQDLPYEIYKKILEQNHIFHMSTRIGPIGIQIKSLLNNYTMYGLSIKKIGTIRQFLQEYERVRRDVERARADGRDFGDFVSFTLGKKQHLISLGSIERIKDRLLAAPERYEFLNVSMVLKAGLGPQGKGFTYSTPYGGGELIEICSDAEENKAYVIHFKQFLKRNFLTRLTSELACLLLPEEFQAEILKYFDANLVTEKKITPGEVAGVADYLAEYLEKALVDIDPQKIEQLADQTRQVISRILVPITMEDQFRCRMDLVAKGQVASEEVAKLTSLREKSHYDILRERFFFQVLVDNFVHLNSNSNLDSSVV